MNCPLLLNLKVNGWRRSWLLVKCNGYIPFFTCNQVLVKALTSSILCCASLFEIKTSCCCFRWNSFFKFPLRYNPVVQVMVLPVKNYIWTVKFNFYLHEWQQCTTRLCSKHGLFSTFTGFFFIYISWVDKGNVEYSGANFWYFFHGILYSFSFVPTFVFIQVLMTSSFMLSQIFLVSYLSA